MDIGKTLTRPRASATTPLAAGELTAANNRRETMTVVAIAIMALCAWTLFAGKDVSWDLINHHLYLPFSLLSGRFEIDLFAANTQSYQNPLIYVPFYLLATSHLPAWAVGLLLTVLHAACVVPLWSLIRHLWPAPQDAVARALALALSLAAPILLITIGTSSGDPISNLLVLSALALAAGRGQSTWSALAAGALMGIAFGLKPTSAVLLLAGGLAMLLRVATGTATLRVLCFQIAGTLLGALVAMGPWALWLWQTFGNPVYPLFNQLFQSPYAPLEPMVDLRFVPDQVSALWTRLFDIATYRSYVHTEGVAPDLRPLALVVLGVASLAVGGIRARAWRSSSRAALASETAPLVVFVVGGYVPWLLASGNSRYLIPAFALVGLLLVKAAETAMPRRLAHSLLGVLLLLQCAYFVHGDDHRYQPKPWDSRPYLDVEVPSRLQQQPFLHLSIGTPSFAGLAPSIARDGAFINIMGPLSLPTTGPLGSALRQRLDAWQGRTRLLMQAREGRGTLADEQRFRQRIDRIVYRFGLNVDWIDCLDIQIHLDPPAAPSRAGKAGAPVRLRSCGSVTRTLVDPTYEAAAAAAESVFGTVEAQCPLIFGPRPMAIDGDLDAWQRRYLNSNARLTLSDQDGLLLTHFRSAQVVSLGSANDILAGRGKNACVAWNELKVQ